jgi:hypothetical protein
MFGHGFKGARPATQKPAAPDSVVQLEYGINKKAAREGGFLCRT